MIGISLWSPALWYPNRLRHSCWSSSQTLTLLFRFWMPFCCANFSHLPDQATLDCSEGCPHSYYFYVVDTWATLSSSLLRRLQLLTPVSGSAFCRRDQWVVHSWSPRKFSKQSTSGSLKICTSAFIYVFLSTLGQKDELKDTYSHICHIHTETHQLIWQFLRYSLKG